MPRRNNNARTRLREANSAMAGSMRWPRGDKDISKPRRLKMKNAIKTNKGGNGLYGRT